MRKALAWALAAVLVLGCGGAAFTVRAEAAETVVAPGVIQGDTYENDTLGIGFRLGDGWTFASAEEIESSNGFVLDHSDSEQLAEALEAGTNYMDMAASWEGGLQNVNLIIQDMGVVLGAVASEQVYVDVVAGQLEELILSVDYIEEATFEPAAVTFVGAEHAAIVGHEVMTTGDDIYQLQVVLKSGQYIAAITMTSYVEDHTSEMADMFYSLEDGPAERPMADEGGAVSFLDAMGQEGTAAYLDLIGLSDWVYQEGGKRYYAAEDEDYLYIVAVGDDELESMGEVQDYWYRDADAEDHPVYRLTGVMGTISPAVREGFKSAFEIDDEDFDYYFGNDYLDAVR